MNVFKKLLGMAAIAALFCTSACSDDDDPVPGGTTGITIGLKTTGGDETEFIVNREDVMTGEVSAVGEGIEQTGWRFFYPVGKTLFTSGYDDSNECIAYHDNSAGKVVEKGKFIFNNPIEMFGHDGDDTFLGMEIIRTGFSDRQLYFVDVEDAMVTKKVGTRIWEDQANKLAAWPTALMVRGNKLFIPFHKIDSEGNWTTPEPDKAYVAVYPYPNVSSEPEKIIMDERTGNIGANGFSTGLIQADNGDLYSYSCGAVMAGFAPASGKPSGILRIKNGETVFDDSYFLNIEEKTNGGKIFWFDYAGNGKALARIITEDNPNAPWGAYGREIFNQKLVVIDLEAQTVTDVANVPLHAKRYTSPLMVENGMVYVSIETADDAYVYKVDVNKSTAVKGARIIGKTIKGFYKL
ncbi:MAG: DUF4374 domain-containing protein [Bacteroidales bacterium]|nr:DUF4374 domain-containing protein [Bacteroidales bacterium]